MSFQKSVSALLSRNTGPGRVLAVVSSIEEKRQRLLCMEAFLRWRMILRWKSQSPKTSPPPPSPRQQVIRPAYTVSASPPVIRTSANAVRAATCPACGNAYLPEDIFCRMCGRKRDLLSLDINHPVVTMPMQPCRTAPVTAVTVPVPVTTLPVSPVMNAPVTPTSVASIHEELVSTPRSPTSQLASPEVRTEYRTEPVAVVTANEVDGTPRAMSPVRYMQSVVTPEHSPVRFIPRLNSGWPPNKEGRRDGLLRSGSDTSLGPTVWRAR